jgi:hypothetical protein
VKTPTISFRHSKRTIFFGMLASGLVAAYFFRASVPGGITGFHPSGSEGKEMERQMENGTASRYAEIPPIDASLPGVTETATFALG